MCDMSRRLLLQSNPQVDGLVRDDIAVAIANAIDIGAINGSGASGQPTGILGVSGTTVVALGTNGAALTWLAVTSLLAGVGQGNRAIEGAPLAFLTNWQAFAHGLRQLKLTGSTVASYLFEYLQNLNARGGIGTGSCLGFPLHTSQNVPSNLVAGKQAFPPVNGQALQYGQSITDGCVDLTTTTRMLPRLEQGLSGGDSA